MEETRESIKKDVQGIILRTSEGQHISSHQLGKCLAYILAELELLKQNK